MGAVYKAVDEKIDDVVSLKILKPGLTCDPAAVELFQNEVRLARRISHKNVCRVYDFGEESGRYFLTMEYVAGEDLKGVLRMTGPFGIRSAVAVARQLSEGLAEAHRLGIVHRDIKPGNIRIDASGAVRSDRI
jgi:serine/threonine-protein kinase